MSERTAQMLEATAAVLRGEAADLDREARRVRAADAQRGGEAMMFGPGDLGDPAATAPDCLTCGTELQRGHGWDDDIVWCPACDTDDDDEQEDGR